MKIAYEPHPVTPERKAELRGQGFKIVDIRFKPQGAVDEAPERITPESIDSMKRAEVLEVLKAHGIADPIGKVAELREAAKRVMFSGL